MQHNIPDDFSRVAETFFPFILLTEIVLRGRDKRYFRLICSEIVIEEGVSFAKVRRSIDFITQLILSVFGTK